MAQPSPTTTPTQLTIRTQSSAALLAEIATLSIAITAETPEQAISSRSVVTTTDDVHAQLQRHLTYATDPAPPQNLVRIPNPHDAIPYTDSTGSTGTSDADNSTTRAPTPPRLSTTSPIAFYTISSLTTNSFDELSRDHMRTGRTLYSARSTVTIKFRDFSALATLIKSLATTPHVRLESVDWSLTPATHAALEEQARVQALRVAMRRARAYADVLGLQGVSVVRVEDREEGGDGDARGRRVMTLSAMRGGYGGGGQGEEGISAALEFQPEIIEVPGEIVVDFHVR